MLQNIAIICGGPSGEHNVSLRSAVTIAENIDTEKYTYVIIYLSKNLNWYQLSFAELQKLLLEKTQASQLNQVYPKVTNNGLEFYNNSTVIKNIDCYFPIVHGDYGEDGRLQSLFEISNQKYVGCNFSSSYLCMDKEACKTILESHGIATTPFISFNKNTFSQNQNKIINDVKNKLQLPIFIKPARSGSSLGVYKISTPEDLIPKIEQAFLVDTKVILEEAIDAREIECAVLGNEEPKISDLAEIIPTSEFYSFESKYLDQNGAEFQVPAQINTDLTQQIKEISQTAFKKLGLSGMARVDFFIDKNNSNIYVNEINTLPGFTSISQYPQLWEKSGLPIDQLIDQLIQLGISR